MQHVPHQVTDPIRCIGEGRSVPVLIIADHGRTGPPVVMERIARRKEIERYIQ